MAAAIAAVIELIVLTLCGEESPPNPLAPSKARVFPPFFGGVAAL